MRRFHGVATKNLPNDPGWRRTLEALDDNATSADWILGAIGLGSYQRITPKEPIVSMGPTLTLVAVGSQGGAC